MITMMHRPAHMAQRQQQLQAEVSSINNSDMPPPRLPQQFMMKQMMRVTRINTIIITAPPFPIGMTFDTNSNLLQLDTIQPQVMIIPTIGIISSIIPNILNISDRIPMLPMMKMKIMTFMTMMIAMLVPFQ
jgi:hypothetical protein